MTPEGHLSSALIPAGHHPDLFEVFCHPFTAGELVAQSRLGALRINGREAEARVVERLGDGDYIVRLELVQQAATVLELVA